MKPVLILAAALLAPAWAQAENPQAPRIAAPPAQVTTLKNGMKVIVLQRKMSPTIAFNMAFRVGGSDNPAGLTGLSHLFEHMAFKGTKTVGTSSYAKEKPLLDRIEACAAKIKAENAKGAGADQKKIASLRAEIKNLEKEEDKYIIKNEFQKIYQEMGGQHLNAYTSNDLTAYTVSLPSNRLEAWMAIESDRIKNSVLREFYRERDVVLEEMRMGDSDPARMSFKTMLAHAFEQHPYRNPVIGWESDVSNLTRTDAENFFKTYYSPNNAVVSIVGDVEPREAARLMEKYFGGIPAKPTARQQAPSEAAQKGERRISLQFPAEPRLLAAWHTPNLSNPDYFSVEMLCAVLSWGRTSRLYKSLVDGKQLAVSAGAYSQFPGERYDALTLIAATPRSPHTLDELEAGIYAEIERIKQTPPDREELDKALAQMTADLLGALESNEGLADIFSSSEITAGDWSFAWKAMELRRKVSPEDLSRAASKYLTDANRTVVRLSSGGESKAKESK